MIIQPTEIYYNKTKCIGKNGNKDILGYWIKFRFDFGEGYAYLFPYGNADTIILNKLISVETTQDKITNFKKILDEMDIKKEIKLLDNEANYRVIGEVEVVYRDEEALVELVYINVRDCSFALDRNEIVRNELGVGDIVEFTLNGLELYDEGIY